MWKSPKVNLSSAQEDPIETKQFDCEVDFANYLRKHVKKIQIGIGVDGDVLTGQKYKIKEYKSQEIADFFDNVAYIDIYEGCNYAFGWIEQSISPDYSRYN